MTLSAKDVEEITKLLADSNFDELDLEIDGFRIHLTRNGAAGSLAPVPAVAPKAARVASAAAPPAAVKSGLNDVVAPLLGTYYRAPRPGAPPFVDVGSKVEADTIVGIIEVMKLMTTVRAGARGTVREILARDGELVEYGAPLLRLTPAP